ncbi:MAG: heat-inducible transcription repressor HrcA [Clostridiales bacterium]|nr:heat-inducible transcription repressor HrcA [Clostridiales bacterium]
MDLNERRQKILAAIIEQYVKTGEPVGSKSLLEALQLSLSSATIRNEMAELVEMGYLEQPHTSAGRVPSHKGYRYYIDNLMGENELNDVQRRRIEQSIPKNMHEPERLLEQANEVLANITNCTAVSTTPACEGVLIRKIEMIPIGSRTAMLVILTSTGILKSEVCRAGGELTPAVCEAFYNIISRTLIGRRIDDVSSAMLQTIAATVSDEFLTILPLLAGVADIAAAASQADVLLEGQSNLFNHRELEENALELIEFLKKSERLSRLLASGKAKFDIKIGEENEYRQLKNSSLIVAKYNIKGKESGTIGLIGPTRLNYAQLIPSIKYLTDLVGRIITQGLEE